MNRRNFLKLIPYGLLGQFIQKSILAPQKLLSFRSTPNILVIVFDAWSAKNLSLYGYGRDTTPNINKLAEKAIVYHNHHASGSFTAPGTASLLTGLYPWHHGVLNCGQKLAKNKEKMNIFTLLQKTYYQVTYTHNNCAESLLWQQKNEISEYLDRSKLFIDQDVVFDSWFSKDSTVSNIARQLSLFNHEQFFQTSLFLNRIYTISADRKAESRSPQYPRGIPKMGDSAQRFFLEDAIDWISSNINDWPEPYFSYIHLLPPHAPYRTRSEFIDLFRDDGYKPIDKPNHLLSPGISKAQMTKERREYDEFIRLVDSEFARLYQHLKNSGALDNTWLFLTSDHGELFERGEYHHTTKVLYEPVIHIPLIVFPPGQTNRIDISTPTSAVDLLPTILRISENIIPNWVEGTPLPFNEISTFGERPIFAMSGSVTANLSSSASRTHAMFYKGHKIMKWVGYSELGDFDPLIEVYDLESDPEELNNLFPLQTPIVKELVKTLDERIIEESQKNLSPGF